MKKAITILAVLIVLVGAVFADPDPVLDGASAIRVTTSVEAIEPIFILRTEQLDSDEHVTDVEGVRTPVAVATAKSTALAGDDSHEITVNALIADNQTVNFEVVQTNDTKAIKKYQFTAAATDLELYQYVNAAGVTVQESQTPHPGAAANKKFTVQNSGVINTFADGELTANTQAKYAGTATAKTVEYVGTVVDADTTVVTFSCTWNKNADAVVGDYQGTVTLTVATV